MGVHEVVSTNNHLKMFIDLIFGVAKVFYDMLLLVFFSFQP